MCTVRIKHDQNIIHQRVFSFAIHNKHLLVLHLVRAYVKEYTL